MSSNGSALNRPYVSVDYAQLSDDQKTALKILQDWRDDANNQDLADDPHGYIRKFLTDVTLHRYLVARNWQTDSALAQLRRTVVWRRKTFGHIEPDPAFPDAPKMECEQCLSDPASHCFFPVGWDDVGRPILYGCQKRMAYPDVEASLVHVFYNIEKSLRSTRSSGQFIYFVDFNGFDFQEALKARYAIRFLMTFADHYPERLGRMVLVNPPSVFQMFYNAAKVFADQRTMNKVLFLYTPSNAKSQPDASTFGDPNVDGLMTQLRDLGMGNRDPSFLSWFAAALRMEAKPGNLPNVYGWAEWGKKVAEYPTEEQPHWVARDKELHEIQVSKTPWTCMKF
ncbi:CRAL/TRIO domain-containing protein [Gonapodya prolifera JEL478]|uniref:CRAL/TRIO domain-containing protein n=1 Tax=Gonapodya prolifera (strain JEL478) TaxID=1344416 RepID=A0A139AMN5_GONPJ|nr:CRAL/TRIO domain-containing protein [Gonapodya prolifera JEL478]|eukprot:KXS18027.1 CRAL/TRIO domain-containing protein [Gonapodya prolifera JEL478]